MTNCSICGALVCVLRTCQERGGGDLFELVHTEDTPSVLPVRACLTPITCREPGITNRQVLLHHPFVCMQGTDRLLGGCNQVLVVLLVTIHDLVQFLIKLLQLRRLRHHILQHELWCLQGDIFPLGEELEAVVDEGLVQEDAPTLQEVATMPNHLDTALGLVAVEAGEHVVVGETIAFLDDHALGRPRADQLVVVFVVANGNSVVNDVADGAELCVEGLFDDSGGDLEAFLFGLEAGFVCEEEAGVFFRLRAGVSCGQRNRIVILEAVCVLLPSFSRQSFSDSH